MGNHKYIKTPEELFEMWKAYKLHVKANPRYRYIMAQKTGELVPEPLECPLTQQGFEVFCHDKFSVTINSYFDNKGGAYDEFSTICTRIVQERKDDQITGGMVGQYNASITQRLNGLKESVEQTNIEQPLFGDNTKPMD
jgi:hypothetical protein